MAYASFELMFEPLKDYANYKASKYCLSKYIPNLIITLLSRNYVVGSIVSILQMRDLR